MGEKIYISFFSFRDQKYAGQRERERESYPKKQTDFQNITQCGSADNTEGFLCQFQPRQIIALNAHV
jgi:hypothetical protein